MVYYQNVNVKLIKCTTNYIYQPLNTSSERCALKWKIMNSRDIRFNPLVSEIYLVAIGKFLINPKENE